MSVDGLDDRHLDLLAREYELIVSKRVDSDVAIDADGAPRCRWATSAPEYVAYHDSEWGRPVRDDLGLYERLCLEAFQSGLSWLTILRKREAFRRAFAGFEIDRVAAFDARDVKRLLADTGIVRNRAKIEAAIANARAAMEIRADDESLAELIWSFAPTEGAAPRSLEEVPSKTPESTALARELKRRGFRFVGPTTAYALMQACGLVNDHLAGCAVRNAVERERSASSGTP
jgi:DNA-3-methyladenine glycosylase I